MKIYKCITPTQANKQPNLPPPNLITLEKPNKPTTKKEKITRERSVINDLIVNPENFAGPTGVRRVEFNIGKGFLLLGAGVIIHDRH